MRAVDPAAALVIVAALALGIRLIAGSFDGDRIEDYLRERSCTLVSKQWAPFGKGWFGDRNRIYEIEYEDAKGNRYRATVKTRALAGVYLTEERLVRVADPPGDAADQLARLRQENAELRAELHRRAP